MGGRTFVRAAFFLWAPNLVTDGPIEQLTYLQQQCGPGIAVGQLVIETLEAKVLNLFTRSFERRLHPVGLLNTDIGVAITMGEQDRRVDALSAVGR